MALDCQFGPLLVLLAAIDDAEVPDDLSCQDPAVFTTVVVRERNGVRRQPIRSRTCARHDAAFRADPGYQDSIRLPGPAPTG